MKITSRLPAELRESATMAVTAIAAHKLRSALTLLGVLVGVFSIIVVMTAMRVLQNNIERQLASLGGETFMVRKWPGTFWGVSPGDYEKYWRRKNVTMDDGRRLMEKMTLPADIGIEAMFWSGEIKTRYKTSAPTVRLYGETPGSFPAHAWDLADGRLLMDADVEGARNVCVLGSGLATNIFPNSSPLGELVKVDGISYTVIGVLASKGGAAGGDQDNFVVVPLSTCLNRYGHWWRSLNILVQAPDRASYDATVEEVRGIMRVIRKVPPGKDDDFEIASNNSMIEQFNKFTKSVRIGVAVVSSIALLAAGIGIMNIMLVSVTERTREIGIRKAVGARRSDILVQFLVEAVLVSVFGGLAGIAAGLIGSQFKIAGVQPVIAPYSIGLAFGAGVLTGLFFGTYPAGRAAAMRPIDALRFE